MTTYGSQFTGKVDPGLRLGDIRSIVDSLINVNAASTAYGITATGTNAATATPLTSTINQIDTVNTNGGIALPSSTGRTNTPYKFCIVINNTASLVNVYASTNSRDILNVASQAASSTALYVSAKGGYWFQLVASASGSIIGQNVLNLSLPPYNLPTGGDDTTAINAALAAAKITGQAVYAPGGVYKHAGLIIVDSVVLYGDGTFTEFQSTDTTTPNPQLAIEVIGDGPGVNNIKVTTTWAGARQANNHSAAIEVEAATNYRIMNNTIVGAGSVGIGNWGGVNGLIQGNNVSNTKADGIHITNVASDIRVIGNYENNTGDDCISVVSYVANGDLCRRITIMGNVMRNGLARGVTVIGGEQVTITGNVIDNPISSAFSIVSDGSYLSYGVDNVTITGNVSHNSGEVTPSIIASVLIAGRSGFPVTNVTLGNNVMDSVRLTGVQIGAGTNFTSQINIVNNQFTGVGGSTCRYGVYFNGVSSVNVSGNYIYNFSQDGIVANTVNSGYARITNNHIKQVNTLASGSVRAISMFNAGFTGGLIVGNTQENGSTTVQYIVLTGSGENGFVIENNYGDNSSYSLTTKGVGNVQGTFTVGNALNSSISQTTLSGTTAGSIVWSQPLQGSSTKRFVAYANGYENNTAVDQTITFTTAFSHAPGVVLNDTGLTISATTTTLTITAPNSVTTFTGNIVIEGF